MPGATGGEEFGARVQGMAEPGTAEGCSETVCFGSRMAVTLMRTLSFLVLPLPRRAHRTTPVLTIVRTTP